MKRSILLAEDDMSLGFLLQDNLTMAGYNVKLCTDGGKALTAFHNGDFDLCVLDVMMPVMDGFVLAEKIKKLNQQVPLIFLTARTQLDDKLKGFSIGADDYVSKPFSIEELKCRVAAVMARHQKSDGERSQTEHMQIGQMTLVANEKLLIHGEVKIKLTNKEAQLLKILAQNLGVVMEREILLQTIWHDDGYFVGRSMDVFMSLLRKKLKADPAVKIMNVHGIGYKLDITSEYS